MASIPAAAWPSAPGEPDAPLPDALPTAAPTRSAEAVAAAEVEPPSAEAEAAPAAGPLAEDDDSEPDQPGGACVGSSFTYVPSADEAAVDFSLHALPVQHGYLYKKSPRKFRLKIKEWDWRYFVIRDMHVLWWRRKEDAESPEAAAPDGGPHCKGTINLVLTPVELEVGSDSDTVFLLRPKDGKWTESSKAVEERTFVFDATGSEHSRSAWMAALYAHVQHAEKVRAQFGPSASLESGRTSMSLEKSRSSFGGFRKHRVSRWG